jgi:hypothetical protein
MKREVCRVAPASVEKLKMTDIQSRTGSQYRKRCFTPQP